MLGYTMNLTNVARRKRLNFPSSLAALLVFALSPISGHAQTTNRLLSPGTTASPEIRRPVNEPANPALPLLFVIGDSTVRNGQGNGADAQWGWGDVLAPYFDTKKINVVNRALGGTSSRTFYRDQWPGVLARLKPGDFVMMQFGHNDGGAINDTNRARGTIKGVGDGTQEIDNLITKQHETVHSFGWYEKQMIAESRTRGATPMVCSLIPHNTWKNGVVVQNKQDYAGWAGGVAQSENAPFLEINEIIARQYDQMGEEKVKPLFVVGAGPHTSRAGAETNAACVVSALKGLKENPLAQFFSEKAGGVAPADLNRPAPGPVTRPLAVRTVRFFLSGIVSATLLTAGGAALGAQTSLRFDFGGDRLSPGRTQVSPTNFYSSEAGYGFEPGAEVFAGSDSVTSSNPFYFSVRLPEGNYRRHRIMGGGGESTTTVKAELRRLMLGKNSLAAG